MRKNYLLIVYIFILIWLPIEAFGYDEFKPIEQLIIEKSKPNGDVKSTRLYIESLSLNSSGYKLICEENYNITGLLDSIEYYSVNTNLNGLITIKYFYDSDILNKILCFLGNDKISSSTILSVNPDKYIFAQTVNTGFSNISELINVYGEIHFELFKPLNFITSKLGTVVEKDNNIWNRLIYSPKQNKQSKTIFFDVDIYLKDGLNWKFVFNDKINGIEKTIELVYCNYGPKSIKIFNYNELVSTDTFDYSNFDNNGNWTRLIKTNSISKWEYLRKIDYY